MARTRWRTGRHAFELLGCRRRQPFFAFRAPGGHGHLLALKQVLHRVGAVAAGLKGFTANQIDHNDRVGSTAQSVRHGRTDPVACQAAGRSYERLLSDLAYSAGERPTSRLKSRMKWG